MAVNHNIPLSAVTDPLCTPEKKICKNHVLHKKNDSCYFICLGVLSRMVDKQMQNKCIQNDHLYLVTSKYTENLYKWIRQYKYNQTSINEFLKPLIVPIALFAVGVKLTNELVAWKLS